MFPSSPSGRGLGLAPLVLRLCFSSSSFRFACFRSGLSVLPLHLIIISPCTRLWVCRTLVFLARSILMWCGLRESACGLGGGLGGPRSWLWFLPGVLGGGRFVLRGRAVLGGLGGGCGCWRAGGSFPGYLWLPLRVGCFVMIGPSGIPRRVRWFLFFCLAWLALSLLLPPSPHRCLFSLWRPALPPCAWLAGWL